MAILCIWRNMWGGSRCSGLIHVRTNMVMNFVKWMFTALTQSLESVLASVIICVNTYIILYDNVLKPHFFQVLCVCLLLFVICCHVTLSTVCVLRPKPEAEGKSIPMLCDSDLESDDDKGVNPDEKSSGIMGYLKTICIFIMFRPMYGAIITVGLLLVFPSIYLCVLAYSEEPVFQIDIIFAILTLLNVTLSCILLVFVLTFVPDVYPYEPFRKSYSPFDEFIEVPMKVLVSKVCAALYNSLCSVLWALLFLISAIFGLLKACGMPESEISRYKEGSKREHTYSFMISMLIITTVTGLVRLLQEFLKACKMAKENLLVIFEKNWERNMKALEFLLPQTEVDSLEELRQAFWRKRGQENLSQEEKRTLQYISRPFWKVKRAFTSTPLEPTEENDPTSPRFSPRVTRSMARRRNRARRSDSDHGE